MFKTFEFGSSCIQVLITGNDTTSSDWNVGEDFSEDCLYLNIWAPHPRREKRAVMVGVNLKSSFFHPLVLLEKNVSIIISSIFILVV